MSEQDLQAKMLGLGLDCSDGHVRATRGTNYLLVGGSEETHERMQELAVKFNEELDRRDKRLEDLGGKEFQEIACIADPGADRRPDEK